MFFWFPLQLLTYFGATDRPDELSFFLTEAFLLRWLTLLDSRTVIAAVLLFWV